MKELTTIDSITKWLTEQVEKDLPIGPDVWMDCASRLNVLLQNEQDKLFELEQGIAKTKTALLEYGKTSAYAKTAIEATDAYTAARKQKAKIDRALSLIQIAKLNARVAAELMKNQLN